MTSKICKRCGEHARLDDPFYRGFGAISRTDNKTMICSDCGVEEAYDDFRRLKLVPKEFWPIKPDSSDWPKNRHEESVFGRKTNE